MTTNSESNPADFFVMVGSQVIAQDGQDIGEVKEVLGEHFKVDAPMALDYWLSKEVISSVQGEVVYLDYAGDQLDAFKLEGPVPASSVSPVLDEQTDVFRDTDEQHESRHEQAGS